MGSGSSKCYKMGESEPFFSWNHQPRSLTTSTKNRQVKTSQEVVAKGLRRPIFTLQSLFAYWVDYMKNMVFPVLVIAQTPPNSPVQCIRRLLRCLTSHNEKIAGFFFNIPQNSLRKCATEKF